MSSVDPEQLFLSNLPLIERIISVTARRHALSASDAEDFDAWSKGQLIEDNYAKLRKFRGDSALGTYLNTVFVFLFRDYRNSRWGRWRPSAEAKRRGPIAVRLEELVYRDNVAVRDAIQTLRSRGVEETESELAKLAASLPQRRAGKEVGLEALGGDAEAASAPSSDVLVEEQETVRAVREVLEALIADLSPKDALILRMRYWDNQSVANIARVTGDEQKILYRRFDVIAGRLRSALEKRGIDRARAVEILSGGFTW